MNDLIEKLKHLAQLNRSANNCWDLYNALPHDMKTRVITLGLISLVRSNFRGQEVETFWAIISGRK